MAQFETMRLPRDADVFAPDGSEVRILLQLSGGSMAHFQLAPGQASKAVKHRSVDELWYVISGAGQMWREQDGRVETVDLQPGSCISIPVGTAFQFRSAAGEPLCAVAVTMPPWPGDDEAVFVDGLWEPELSS